MAALVAGLPRQLVSLLACMCVAAVIAARHPLAPITPSASTLLVQDASGLAPSQCIIQARQRSTGCRCGGFADRVCIETWWCPWATACSSGEASLWVQADPGLAERDASLLAEFEAAPWLLPPRTKALKYAGVHKLEELLQLRAMPHGNHTKTIAVLLFSKNIAPMAQNTSEQSRQPSR